MTVTCQVAGLLVEPVAARAFLHDLLIAATARLVANPTCPTRQALARAAISEAHTWRLISGEPTPTPVLHRALVRLAARPTSPTQRDLARAALAAHQVDRDRLGVAA